MQEWIPGDDQDLYFCALMLDRGEEVMRFGGRKLLSHPPALGQTTVAEPYSDQGVYEYTNRFFKDLNFSGCVSLEVKKDKNGELWVIEPTVGRTDYWYPLCSANNYNFIEAEYQMVCEQLDQGYNSQGSKGKVVRWFDVEKDPFCYMRYIFNNKFSLSKASATFSYLNCKDIRPSVKSFIKLIQRKIKI